MSWFSYKPYVSVAQRKAKATKLAAKMAKKGVILSPVILAGKAIANTFWGKAWCNHLESLSDFENRLPRGRSYVRSGAVIDLKIEKGVIYAQIQGSSLYKGHLYLTPLDPKKWEKIKAECSGKIDSMIELLQGKFSSSVMEVITRKEGGLFPKPAEIKMNCSCPDSAELCKHLAAVFYGVGARLDLRPELLFVLRGVDPSELISAAAKGTSVTQKGAASLDSNLAEIFGIEIVQEEKRIPSKLVKSLAKMGSPKKTALQKKMVIKKIDSKLRIQVKKKSKTAKRKLTRTR